ncbi:UNVERIFIED_CONTAM: hypothetical protein FKN15_066020 [Acipenser sinensis]
MTILSQDVLQNKLIILNKENTTKTENAQLRRTLGIFDRRTVAGAPERGAAGHEEGGRGLETTFPSSSFAAGVPVAGAPQRGAAGYEEGGGRGTTCPRSFFAAGVTVAGAPQRGAAGYEEGGGRGTTCPRSNFAAGVDQHAVGRATTGRGADSMASHGPSEASLTSPRLCPGLLGF